MAMSDIVQLKVELEDFPSAIEVCMIPDTNERVSLIVNCECVAWSHVLHFRR